VASGKTESAGDLSLNHRMKLLVAFAATFLFMTASAWAERLPTHHTRPPLQQYFLRKMEAAQILNLNVVLPLRNTTQLDTLLQQIYDPTHASFGQYLTVDQFTEQFGPTESDHTAVIEFLQSNGL
jgi:subtilase family serine protease